ncbi:MAG: DUF4169 family protein [Pseudomonadota bacterium]
MKVVNLRTARKRKAKAAASEASNANRIAHGLSAAQRKAARDAQDGLDRHVDAHKLDGPTPD